MLIEIYEYPILKFFKLLKFWKWRILSFDFNLKICVFHRRSVPFDRNLRLKISDPKTAHKNFVEFEKAKKIFIKNKFLNLQML